MGIVHDGVTEHILVSCSEDKTEASVTVFVNPLGCALAADQTEPESVETVPSGQCVEEEHAHSDHDDDHDDGDHGHDDVVGGGGDHMIVNCVDNIAMFECPDDCHMGECGEMVSLDEDGTSCTQIVHDGETEHILVSCSEDKTEASVTVFVNPLGCALAADQTEPESVETVPSGQCVEEEHAHSDHDDPGCEIIANVDINGDGKINVMDINLLVQCAIGEVDPKIYPWCSTAK